MSLRVTGNAISSDVTESTALYEPDDGLWSLSWRDGRYDRNQAISGMQAQEYRAMGQGDSPHVADWEAELDQ